MVDRCRHGLHFGVLVGNGVPFPGPECLGERATKSGLTEGAEGDTERARQVVQGHFSRELGGGGKTGHAVIARLQEAEDAVKASDFVKGRLIVATTSPAAAMSFFQIRMAQLQPLPHVMLPPVTDEENDKLCTMVS